MGLHSHPAPGPQVAAVWEPRAEHCIGRKPQSLYWKIQGKHGEVTNCKDKLQIAFMWLLK